MNLMDYTHYYLVGIKGVAMTSLAQVLLDAGKVVYGSDTDEDFVTKKILSKLSVKIDTDFTAALPPEINCIVYTAAHKGQFNPQVQAARTAGIPTFSQAEAIAAFFNAKKGIAVCGVGGKSTTSAMITWILEKTGHAPSFSVGVGKIIGMERTGKWDAQSEYFVAEADEYVTDPSAPSRGEPITPRFSYLHPHITVCTNYKYDHPDVYKKSEDTHNAFQNFFNQIDTTGTLILNYADLHTVPLSKTAQKILYMGNYGTADFGIIETKTECSNGTMKTVFFDARTQKEYPFSYQLPGIYNLENAAFAILACEAAGVPIAESCEALSSFQSTQRRFEKVGEKNGVLYFDDYAHHPSEVAQVIDAIYSWFPQDTRVVIAFQSHTFSRTKELFSEFVSSFSSAKEVVLLDIFPSARESFDTSITSDMLVTAIKEKYPRISVQNLKTISALSEFLKRELHSGDVCITIGAGDIYKVHELI